jgi:16S rRNA (cytosine967-C5)-methyltransferase
LLGAEPGETVLDLSAGAGGKSLLLAAQGARVLAYDVDRERLKRLETRARRAGADRLIEIVDRPRSADRVLVDAPCSELGVLRRGPDARWRIDPRSLTELPPLQHSLLERAAPLAVKRLVYGTCTVNRAENEDVADAFDRDHPEFERITTWRTLPHVNGTDGFFAAVWERARH